MNIKAMTYNIRSGRNLANDLDIRFAAEILAKADPDFVGLNEVRSHTPDIGPVDQAQQLGEILGWNWAFGRSIDLVGGAYGNAFLSKHPILATEVLHIPDPPKDGSAHFEHRSIFRNVVEIQGKAITILCSHFGLAKTEQQAAVAAVLEALENEPHPVILLGDFNMKPEDPTLAPLHARLTDSAKGQALPLTFPSGEPRVKIDYIFTDAQFQQGTLRTLDTQNSDHLPLLLDLTID